MLLIYKPRGVLASCNEGREDFLQVVLRGAAKDPW